MTKLIAFALTVSSTAALAHPSLLAHDHPHGVSGLMGLDLMLVAAFTVAVAFAAWRQVRS